MPLFHNYIFSLSWDWDINGVETSKPLPVTQVAQLICVGDVGTFLNIDFELMPLQDKPSEKVFYACLD